MINDFFEKSEMKNLSKNEHINFMIVVLFGEISELLASLEDDDVTAIRIIRAKYNEFLRFVAMQNLVQKENKGDVDY